MAKYKVHLNSVMEGESPFVEVDADNVFDSPNRGGELRFTNGADPQVTVALFPPGRWAYYTLEKAAP